MYIRLGDAFFRSLASALSASADSSLSPFGPLSAVQAASASFDNLPALVARLAPSERLVGEQALGPVFSLLAKTSFDLRGRIVKWRPEYSGQF